MLALVNAHRHKVRLVEQDIRRHQHRIIEEADVDVVGVLGALILVLRHAAHFAHVGEAIEHPRKLGVRGNVALAVNQALLGVDAAGDVDSGKLHAAAAQIRRILPDGDGVHVDNGVDAVVVVLQLGEVAERADVIAQRQRTGRLDAGEDNRLLFGLGRGIRFGHGKSLLSE